MLFRLLILFTIIPVIEIYLLIKVGSWIGPLPTVVLLLAISLLGAWLVRSQGFRIFLQIREELSRGRLPAAQLLDGALVLVGGVLLMTPGFFTDFLGIFFLFPFTRSFIKLWLGIWLQKRLAKGGFVTRRHY
ncbi:FxsA family protein [Geomonas sp.]|uniref:FxsA family protein n=1 Tax=Geomonas sp. TaxID=2651584 RepID=UPI002B4A2CB3|nr:FxsA family protein [Geomonas sp.]HJV34062.1 FxsA family protein [Geomonas sp.]